MKKRILSLLLCIVMCLSLMPAVAYAADSGQGRTQLNTPTNIHWEGTVAVWDAVDGATGYEVDVYMEGSPNGAIGISETPLLFSKTSSTSIDCRYQLLNTSFKYYIKVSAVDATGTKESSEVVSGPKQNGVGYPLVENIRVENGMLTWTKDAPYLTYLVSTTVNGCVAQELVNDPGYDIDGLISKNGGSYGTYTVTVLGRNGDKDATQRTEYTYTAVKGISRVDLNLPSGYLNSDGLLVSGKSISGMKYSTTTTGVTNISYAWTENGKAVSTGNVKPGAVYNVAVMMQAAEGYSFTEDLEVYCDDVRVAVTDDWAGFGASYRTVEYDGLKAACLHEGANVSYDRKSHWKVCEDCGTTILERTTHSYTETVSGNSTTYQCSGCDYSYTASAGKTYIGRGDLDFDYCVEGGSIPAIDLTASETDLKIDSFQWYKNDIAEDNRVDVGSTFAAGTYKCVVTASLTNPDITTLHNAFKFWPSASYAFQQESVTLTNNETKLTATLTVTVLPAGEIKVIFPTIGAGMTYGEFEEALKATVNDEPMTDYNLFVKLVDSDEWATNDDDDITTDGSIAVTLFKMDLPCRVASKNDVTIEMPSNAELGDLIVGNSLNSSMLTIGVSYDLTQVVEPAVTPISLVNVNVDAPAYGVAPSKVATPADDTYTAGAVNWDPADETFADDSYTVTVPVTAGEGYGFTDMTAFQINGTVVTPSAVLGAVATLQYTFPKLEKPTYKVIVTNGGSKTTSQSDYASQNEVKAGVTVSIRPNIISDEEVFVKWCVDANSAEVTFNTQDSHSQTNKFTMPEGDVYLTAEICKRITDAQVTVDVPVAGQPLSYQVGTSSNFGLYPMVDNIYTLNGVRWAKGQTILKVADNSVAECGATYEVQMYLLPNEGYAFNMGATTRQTFSVNGEDPVVYNSILLANDRVVALDYEFTVEHDYGAWTSVSETQHQRVCAGNATHTETANHNFSDNTCVDCGDSKSASVLVTFDMNGHGAQISAQSVESGSRATKPADPTAEGWTFDGWYADATFSVKFDFDSAINADTTIYAKWTQNTTPPTTYYGVYVSGVQVTSANKNDVLNDGGKVSYNPESKTLTVLDSANITDTHDGALIYAEGINLTINAPNGLTLENNVAGCGIVVLNGNLTINGNVNITVSEVGANAICAVFGSVNIVGDAVVQFNGAATENYAISASGDLVIAGNATVRGFNYGLYASNGAITVEGSAEIEATVCAMYCNGGKGIEVGKDVTITVSKVWADAIFAHKGSVNIGGNATVQFNGAETESGYEAIYANQDLVIAGNATVRGFNYGLYAENGSVKMTGGKWDISAEERAIRGLSGITIPKTHKITTPADGKIEKITVNTDSGITFEYSTVTASDGTTVAEHAVIESETVNCTVTFEMNGHGTQVEAQTVKSGETASKPADPAASGWTFDGWYADATFSAAFDFDTAIAADTTIYAKWTKETSDPGATDPQPATYTVTFNMNGHGTQVPAQTVEEGNKVTKPADPSASGYTFDGWYADATFSAAFDFDTAINADTTIYAKWTKNSSGSGGSSSGGSSSGSSASATYAITVADSTHGSSSASAKTASAGDTVKITVSPDKGYTLETITVTDKNGKEVALTATKIGETYTFKMPASAVEIEATFMDDNTMLNYFVDVTASDYYYDAVLWAAENGITGGVDAVHFAPSSTCTRAQAVTFLWRAAGCPEVVPGKTFNDVAKDSYYEKAVIWAVSEGITKGTTETTFSPNATCTRGQIVTFLYRANKVDTLNMKGNPFTDVAEGAYYYDAVLWAAENGITGGTSATTFSPDANCTRAQIVTFLYRYMGK